MVDILVLMILFFIFYHICIWCSGREGFEEDTVHLESYNADYAEIYEILWHPKELLQYEQVSMQDIALAELPVSSVKVLDLACGISPHACWFKQLGVEFVGADISKHMLKKAELDCPTAKFKLKDVTQAGEFPPKSFTHTLLLGFSVYEFSNPKTVFDNAFAWTEPGGYLIVHMVDPDKYDPILNLASPFAAFSVQKYSYDRKTKSEIYFTNFKYVGELQKKKDHDDAEFNETFIYFTQKPKYRQQTRQLNMPSMDRLIEMARTSGFRVKEKVHLVQASKEYQYLVYFTK
jgi:ubiquinone/menaquinone biosynthesis C-methylase UbiE